MEKKDNIIKNLRITYYTLAVISAIVGTIYCIKSYYSLSLYNSCKEDTESKEEI
jgi:hypothetical protein